MPHIRSLLTTESSICSDLCFHLETCMLRMNHVVPTMASASAHFSWLLQSRASCTILSSSSFLFAACIVFFFILLMATCDYPQFTLSFCSSYPTVVLLLLLQVLARSSPTDKFNLVKLLKKQGDIVAVTGDLTSTSLHVQACTLDGSFVY